VAIVSVLFGIGSPVDDAAGAACDGIVLSACGAICGGAQAETAPSRRSIKKMRETKWMRMAAPIDRPKSKHD
jgi:hypothetical protein